jgi:hypothetical protein
MLQVQANEDIINFNGLSTVADFSFLIEMPMLELQRFCALYPSQDEGSGNFKQMKLSPYRLQFLAFSC